MDCPPDQPDQPDAAVLAPRVLFYTRVGCHLCEEVWPVLERGCARLGLSLGARDIDGDPALRAAHGDWVPVVEIDGRVRLRGRIDPSWLRRELEAAAAHPVPAAKRLRVSAVILFRAGLMLVNKRPEGGYFGGWWEWPGGKCEPGEQPLACAKRELAEEIGPAFEQAAADWRLVDRRRVSYPGREIDLWFYVARLAEGAPLPHPAADALEHVWLPPKEVLGLQFLEPNLPVLHRIIEAGPGFNPQRFPAS